MLKQEASRVGFTQPLLLRFKSNYLRELKKYILIALMHQMTKVAAIIYLIDSF